MKINSPLKLLDYINIDKLVILTSKILILITCLSPLKIIASEAPISMRYGNYYFFENGYTCRTNTPERTVIKSWKNRIEFSEDNKVLIWGDLCNDNPEIVDFNPSEFDFTEDSSKVKYKFEQYTFYQDKPKLCQSGQWCPVDSQNIEDKN